MKEIFENLKSNNPLVYTLTNIVTVQDVANIMLAAKGSPIMGTDPKEAEELARISSAVVLNIGTLNEMTKQTMLRAGKEANERDIPVLLDPVGAGVSALRRNTTSKLLKEVKFKIIKGNASEIKFIYDGSSTKSGVDVDISDAISEKNLEGYIKMAKELAREYDTVIMITGPIDVITDGDKVYLNRSGTELFEEITGAGCMLAGLTGSVLGANPDDPLKSALMASLYMNVAGERAKAYADEIKMGSGSFKVALLDYINTLDIEEILEVADYEAR